MSNDNIISFKQPEESFSQLIAPTDGHYSSDSNEESLSVFCETMSYYRSRK